MERRHVSKIPRYLPPSAMVVSPDGPDNQIGNNYYGDTNAWKDIEAVSEQIFYTSSGADAKSTRTPHTSATSTASRRRIDKEYEGIGTKSCLSFRFKSNKSPYGSGDGSSADPLTRDSDKTSKSQKYKENNKKGFRNRFGWRGSNRNHSKNSGGATSQSSSQYCPEDEMEPEHSKPVGEEKSMSTPQNMIDYNSTLGSGKDLLIPPPVEDRSERRRLLYEEEKRRFHLKYGQSPASGSKRRGLYEGEIEPEGVRGQEAKTITITAHSTPSHRRILNESSEGNLQIISPVSELSPKHTAMSLSSQQEETEESQRAALHVITPEQYQERRLQQNPIAQRYLRKSDISDSTCSDDELKSMMNDLLPQDEKNDSGDLYYNHPPNLLHSPSARESFQQEEEEAKRQASRSSTPLQNNTYRKPPTHRALRQAVKTYDSKHRQTIDKQPSTGTSTTTECTPDFSTSSTVEALNSVAMEHVNAGEYDEAIQVFTRVLHMHQDQYGENTPNPSTASAYHNLGTVHAKRGQTLSCNALMQRQARASALHCFQAAARSARDSLGRNHPSVAVSLVRIGFLLLQAKQYNNAITTFNEALRIRKEHYGSKHVLVANLYNNLGVCHMHLEEHEQGLECLEEALTIQRDTVMKSRDIDDGEVLKAHMLELADTLFNIGGLCLEWIRQKGDADGRSATALQAFEETLEIRLAAFDNNHKHPAVEQVHGLLSMARQLCEQEQEKRVQHGSKIMSPGKQQQEKSDTKRAEEENAVPEPPEVRRAVRNEIPDGLRLCSRSKSPVPNKLNGFDEDNEDGESSDRGSSIFRTKSNDSCCLMKSPRVSKQELQRQGTAPLSEVSFSRDEADGEMGKILNPNNSSTRIFISPHAIPRSSPNRKPRRSPNGGRDSSNEVTYNSVSLERDSFAVDVSLENSNDDTLQCQKSLPNAFPARSFSYDAEENCLISNTGVDSEHGRIHYPLTWSKAGLHYNDSSSDEYFQRKGNDRDIMVAQPFHYPKSKYGSSDVEAYIRSLGINSSMSSDKWGSETVNFSTGNKDRDDVMTRAKAILEGASFDNDDDTSDCSEELNGEESFLRRNDGGNSSSSLEQDLLEDGVAPLGGEWSTFVKNTGKKRKEIRQLLQDPMVFLPEIHEEASRQLKNNNTIDSLHLFEVVLKCQRRRHGPLHPDVAAALHNVGIAQLRAQNHGEALKAFEEAARVRKGSLGKDHPLVAVSLVKVGITLLLLHRFEEALWSFREALSVRKHALGPLHPSTARIYNNIGCVYVEFNEFREARRAFEAALDTQRNALCHDPNSGPLIFGTATTLCNLGYLYRFRDMHEKAASVLKEAVELQESVLGKTHATVLSTLDNLADSCANSGNGSDALRYYSMVLQRFRGKDGNSNESKKLFRAEAVLHYKMSRVHRQRNDRESQLSSLQQALKAVRTFASDQNRTNVVTSIAGEPGSLERRIQSDIRACRERLEKEELKWI